MRAVRAEQSARGEAGVPTADRDVRVPGHALGIIAVMGAQNGLTIKAQPEDGAVVVVWRTRISQHLSRLPGVLSAGEVDAIDEVARRSTTWRP